MKRLIGLVLGLALASLAGAQNQNNPTQSWVQLLLPPRSGVTQTTGQQQLWQAGIGVFSCVGTWGGATVTLEFQGPDGQTMVVAGTNTTLTANSGGVFYLPVAAIQAVVSSASATTSLTCAAGLVPSPNNA